MKITFAILGLSLIVSGMSFSDEFFNQKEKPSAYFKEKAAFYRGFELRRGKAGYKVKLTPKSRDSVVRCLKDLNKRYPLSTWNINYIEGYRLKGTSGCHFGRSPIKITLRRPISFFELSKIIKDNE